MHRLVSCIGHFHCFLVVVEFESLDVFVYFFYMCFAKPGRVMPLGELLMLQKLNSVITMLCFRNAGLRNRLAFLPLTSSKNFPLQISLMMWRDGDAMDSQP